MIYLDWAATAPIDPEAAAMLASASVEFHGNPSSPYPAGKAAKRALEDSRQRCARVLGCNPRQLSFSSGGSESNAIILLSRLLAKEPGTILSSTLEHPSITAQLRLLAQHGWTVKTLAPANDGSVKPEKLKKALKQHPDTRLITVMGVSNEIGVIQPISDLVRITRDFTQNTGTLIHFHADMIQAIGKIPVCLRDTELDSASFSAHKFRGPRGIGLLYHRKAQIDVLQRGGGQESGTRPGTENVAAIMAMTMALEKYHQPPVKIIENGAWLLDTISCIEGVRIIPETRRKGPEQSLYVPGIIAAAFPPIPGEVLSRVLAESGYEVSTRSACSNNTKGKLSASMKSLGIPREIASCIIRISFGGSTKREELKGFAAVLKEKVNTLRRMTV